MVKVKICGITNLADALKAVEFGADFLGFNFYPKSPRYIAPAAAGAILKRLPSSVANIAVFVNEPRESVEAILRECRGAEEPEGFFGLQFHGDESPAYCRGWELKVIKAFRIRSRESARAVTSFPADYYLLDSGSEDYGGSGEVFSWDWIEGLSAERVFLAGGLKSGNVQEAVRRFCPYAVDVCTGVEAQPGRKDHEKLKEFILAAKAAR
jgi:phosphoribosylanthranilate isomerase